MCDRGLWELGLKLARARSKGLGELCLGLIILEVKNWISSRKVTCPVQSCCKFAKEINWDREKEMDLKDIRR